MRMKIMSSPMAYGRDRKEEDEMAHTKNGSVLSVLLDSEKIIAAMDTHPPEPAAKKGPKLAKPTAKPKATVLTAVLCWVCGGAIYEDQERYDVIMASDSLEHTLCKDCYGKMIQCSDCEEYLNAEAATIVYGGEKVCGSEDDGCLQEYHKCQDCECWVHDDNFITDEHEDIYICRTCYENNYFTCVHCEGIFHCDKYGEDSHCESCWEENHADDNDDDDDDDVCVVQSTSKKWSFDPMAGVTAPIFYSQSGSTVNFECAVKTFYLMYALEERLARKRSELLYTVKRNLTAFSSKFAHALFDYMAVASIGEARHAQWNPASRKIDGFFSHKSRPSRLTVYHEMAQTVDPIASVPALIDIFGSKWRETGYGGEKWKGIVEGYATYPSRTSDIMFIDMAVNKRHNGSLAFDKGIIFKMPEGQTGILSFLDYRREYDLLEFGYQKFHPITPELFSILESAERERVIKSFPRNIKLIDIRWAPPVKWGGIVLKSCDNVPSTESGDSETGDSNECDCPMCKCPNCGKKVGNCVCTEDNNDEGGSDDGETEKIEEKGGYYAHIYNQYREALEILGNVAKRD
jgi:hypothetical protein